MALSIMSQSLNNSANAATTLVAAGSNSNDQCASQKGDVPIPVALIFSAICALIICKIFK